MRGISEVRLKQIAHETHDSDDTNLPVLSLLDLLISECQELNPLLPIDENTPKDTLLLAYYPTMPKGLRFHVISKLVNFDASIHKPTHYQELPDDPEPGDNNG